MEGSTRLNVVNKPLNDLMMHFSKFLAKERILHHVFYFSLLVVEVGCGGVAIPRESYSFSPFLRLKVSFSYPESIF